MAREIGDLRLLFNVLTANDHESREPASAQNLSDLGVKSVAWYASDEVTPITKETRQAVENAARALAEAGLTVEERLPPGIERGHELWLKLFSRASVVLLRQFYTGHEKEAGEFIRWRLANADDQPPASLDDYIRNWSERDRLRAQLIEWMEDVQLLLAPVGASAALVHGCHKVTVGKETFGSFRAFSYSQTFNVFDLPAVSVPAGRSSEGLPIGIQVIGRPSMEESVLAAAVIIEEALGGWQPPPLDSTTTLAVPPDPDG